MMCHAENAFLIDVKSILVLMIVSVDKRGIQVSLLFFHKNIYCCYKGRSENIWTFHPPVTFICFQT